MTYRSLKAIWVKANVGDGKGEFGSILTNRQWRWLFIIQWWNGACNCTSMVHKNLMVPSLFLTLFPFILLRGPNFQWAFWRKFSHKKLLVTSYIDHFQTWKRLWNTWLSLTEFAGLQFLWTFSLLDLWRNEPDVMPKLREQLRMPDYPDPFYFCEWTVSVQLKGWLDFEALKIYSNRKYDLIAHPKREVLPKWEKYK